MTKYLSSTPFSVASAGSQQWRDNHDAIFRCKAEESPGVRCELKRGHLGACRCGEVTWDSE